MLTLISATPSPYARKVRIALQEKNIPFKLQTEVPWDSTTKTPQYNPIEKLPVLILDQEQQNGNSKKEKHQVSAVYESHFILEYLEAKHPSPSLLPTDIDDRLFAKQVEVVTDGICDALVLLFFEKQRDEEKQSEPWKARQQRKIDGGITALARWVEDAGADGVNIFVAGNAFGLADIAVGSVLGYMSLRWTENPWKEKYPKLKSYWEALEQRESFKSTTPSPQKMNEKIV